MLEKGEIFQTTEEVFWRKDGTSFPVEYISTPIWENMKLLGAVVVFKDITRQKQAEEEIHQGEVDKMLRNPGDIEVFSGS